jgi:hypothetical protein
MNPAKKRPPSPAAAWPQETRGAEMATVLWMLVTLFTFVAQLVLLGVRLFLWANQAVVDERSPINSLLVLLHLVGLVAGLAALAFIPLVYRLRATPPPWSVTLFSLLVGLTPLVVLLVRLAMS